MRCPSRRVKANTSTVPSLAELVERDVDGRIEVGEVGAHVVAAEEFVGQRAPAVEQLVGQFAARASSSRRRPCSRRPRSMRRSCARRPARRGTACAARGRRPRTCHRTTRGHRRASATGFSSSRSHGSAASATGGSGSIDTRHGRTLSRDQRLSRRTTPRRSPCSAKSTATSVGLAPFSVQRGDAFVQERRVDPRCRDRFGRRDPVIELEERCAGGSSVRGARRRSLEMAGPEERERRLLHDAGERVGQPGPPSPFSSDTCSRVPASIICPSVGSGACRVDREQHRIQPRIVRTRRGSGRRGT